MPARKNRPTRRKKTGSAGKRTRKAPIYYVLVLGGEWVIRKQGKKALEGRYDTKPKAVLAATRLAKRKRGVLKVKTKTGRIQATRDFG